MKLSPPLGVVYAAEQANVGAGLDDVLPPLGGRPRKANHGAGGWGSRWSGGDRQMVRALWACRVDAYLDVEGGTDSERVPGTAAPPPPIIRPICWSENKGHGGRSEWVGHAHGIAFFVQYESMSSCELMQVPIHGPFAQLCSVGNLADRGGTPLEGEGLVDHIPDKSGFWNAHRVGFSRISHGIAFL